MAQQQSKDRTVIGIAGIIVVVLLGAVGFTWYQSRTNVATQTDRAATKVSNATPQSASSITRGALRFELPAGWKVDETSVMPTKSEADTSVLLTYGDFSYSGGPSWSGHAVAIVKSTVADAAADLTRSEQAGVVYNVKPLDGTHANKAWSYDFAYEGEPYHGALLIFGGAAYNLKYFAAPGENAASGNAKERLAKETAHMSEFTQIVTSLQHQ